MKKLLVVLFSAAIATLLIPSAASAINFLPSASGTTTGVGTEPNWVATGDFNEDGKDDAAIASEDYEGDGKGLFIALSDGDGSFTVTGESPYAVTNSQAQSVHAGEFNGDGFVDLIVGLPGNSTFDIFLGDGEGDFAFYGQTSSEGGYMTDSSITVGDVTADGISDIVIGYYTSRYSVSVGDGNGGFESDGIVTVAGTPGNPLDGFGTIAIGDYNDDGDEDLALGLDHCTQEVVPPEDPEFPLCPNVSPTMHSVFVVQGDSTGTFTPAAGNPHIVAGGDNAKILSVVTGNFDGNSRDDLAVSTLASQVLTYLGDATNFLVANPDTNANLETGSSPESLKIADFDQDGSEDIAWFNRGSDNFGVGLATGNGFLNADGSPFGIKDSSFYHSLAVGDFNGDGVPDMAMADQNSPVGLVALLNSPEIEGDGIDFSEQQTGTTSAPETMTLVNSGAASGEVTGITIEGDDAGRFSSSDLEDCETNIAAGQTCDVTIAFSPTDTGPADAAVEVTYGGSDDPARIPITGFGTVPGIEVGARTFEFGDVPLGADATGSIGVLSTGTAPLSIGDVEVNGPGAGQFSITSDNCGGTVKQPEQACNIEFRIDTGTAGVKAAELRIESDSPDGAKVVALSGTVVDVTPALPKVTLKLKSPAKVKRGKILKVTATVKNTGTATLSGISLKTSVPKKLAKTPKAVRISSLAPGATVKKTIKVSVKKSAKAGKKLKLTVTASAKGKKLKSASRTVKIRK